MSSSTGLEVEDVRFMLVLANCVWPCATNSSVYQIGLARHSQFLKETLACRVCKQLMVVSGLSVGKVGYARHVNQCDSFPRLRIYRSMGKTMTPPKLNTLTQISGQLQPVSEI